MSVAGQYLSGGSSLPQSLQTVIARAPRPDKISAPGASAPSSKTMSTRTGGLFRLQRTLSVVRRGLSSRAPASVYTGAQFSTAIVPLFASKDHAPVGPGPGDRLSFQLAEAYSPKLRDSLPRRPQLARPNTGEDSFFCGCIESGPFKGTVAFAVADGVGGWAEVGIDPSDFSHSLCEKMHARFKALEATRAADLPTKLEDLPTKPAANSPALSATSNADTVVSTESGNSVTSAATGVTAVGGAPVAPGALLQTAFDEIKAEKKVMAGSSTACVGVVSPQTGELQVANLGDSGFLIFREGRLLRQSKPQVHTFNTPYQMAVVPDSWMIDRRQQIADDPADAEVSVHDLQHGDVVVFATDGLTDNLFAHEILKQVTDTMVRTGSWVRRDDEIVPGATMSGGAELASTLVKHATVMSVDSRRSSPFSQELKRVHAITAYGGKPDDVTVVVLLVQGVGH